MRIFSGLIGLAVALAATAGSAQPAPWYKWRSKLNDKIFCAQTSPGSGWALDSGPYKDARCEKPGRPGS
jgi:hypothetical protein